jgi:hypothetical protein
MLWCGIYRRLVLVLLLFPALIRFERPAVSGWLVGAGLGNFSQKLKVCKFNSHSLRREYERTCDPRSGFCTSDVVLAYFGINISACRKEGTGGLFGHTTFAFPGTGGPPRPSPAVTRATTCPQKPTQGCSNCFLDLPPTLTTLIPFHI